MAYNHCKGCGQGIDCMSTQCQCCQGKYGRDYCMPPILKHEGIQISLPATWPAFEEAFANCVYGSTQPVAISFHYEPTIAKKAQDIWEEHKASERHKKSRGN